MAVYANVPTQCGMKIIYDLADGKDLKAQIQFMKDYIFGEGNPKQAMAILTDRVDNEKYNWAQTKAIAFKSEARVNPNTGREVRTYIVYPEHIKQLEAQLPPTPTIASKIVEQIKSK